MVKIGDINFMMSHIPPKVLCAAFPYAVSQTYQSVNPIGMNDTKIG